MNRIRRFLEATPFLRYLAIAAFTVLLAMRVGVWAKARVEAYAYEVLLPRVMEQAQRAVQDGIRNGAGAAVNDATGGIFGRPLPLTGTDSQVSPGLDPCRVRPPTFGIPGIPLSSVP